MHWVTHKAGAKHELLFNKPVSGKLEREREMRIMTSVAAVEEGSCPFKNKI